MAAQDVRNRRWARVEYDRLIEPAEDALRAAFGSDRLIRVQGSVALDDESACAFPNNPQ
jgi:hypothetical protein